MYTYSVCIAREKYHLYMYVYTYVYIYIYIYIYIFKSVAPCSLRTAQLHRSCAKQRAKRGQDIRAGGLNSRAGPSGLGHKGRQEKGKGGGRKVSGACMLLDYPGHPQLLLKAAGMLLEHPGHPQLLLKADGILLKHPGRPQVSLKADSVLLEHPGHPQLLLRADGMLLEHRAIFNYH